MKMYSRGLYAAGGFLLTGLATLGIFLPLLPTTPLLLLAAACFAQSSEKYHRWLTEHRIFGPTIRNWQKNRTIPKKSKATAIISIVLFGSYAIGFAVENLYVRLIGVLILLIGLISVLRLKTSD